MQIIGCVSKQEQKGASTNNTLPYYNTPDFTPIWNVDNSRLDTIHSIAAFHFTDQNGTEVTNTDFDGKVYVANFFFTRCGGICPVITKNMQTVANKYTGDNRVMFISHSVTPYMDSVAVLNAFAKKYEVDSNRWKMVTGSKGDIYSLARQSYFAEDAIGFNSDSTEFLHTERFVLVDKHRHLRGVYNGTVALEMDRLKEDIDILLQE